MAKDILTSEEEPFVVLANKQPAQTLSHDEVNNQYEKDQIARELRHKEEQSAAFKSMIRSITSSAKTPKSAPAPGKPGQRRASAYRKSIT